MLPMIRPPGVKTLDMCTFLFISTFLFPPPPSSNGVDFQFQSLGFLSGSDISAYSGRLMSRKFKCFVILMIKV